MLIGEAARKTGMSVKAIRFYEAVGLIPPPPRVGRYRQYDDTMIGILLLIKEAKAFGLTIAELKHLAGQVKPESDIQLIWQQVAAFLLQQKARLRADIQALEQQLAQIDFCLAQMESCPVSDPSQFSAN